MRAKVRGTAERPRLSVFRSNRGIRRQLIDDVAGHTLAAVNWTEADLKALPADGAGQAGRRAVAERAKAAGVETWCSTAAATATTAGCKALADGAREGGLNF